MANGSCPFKFPIIFEHVYFARPDSVVFGRNVAATRKSFGAQLAKEHPAVADIVVPVPDSGSFAAIGYSEESGIPYGIGLVRNHYVGRTFIEPKQSIRHFGVKVKLNAVKSVVGGKRVILVDDSIVRGTTSKKIVRMLKQSGALEVHMRISSPPTIGPCYYGIDTPRRKELTAATHDVEATRRFIEASTLGYLSLEGMLAAIGKGEDEMCAASAAAMTTRTSDIRSAASAPDASGPDAACRPAVRPVVRSRPRRPGPPEATRTSEPESAGSWTILEGTASHDRTEPPLAARTWTTLFEAATTSRDPRKTGGWTGAPWRRRLHLTRPVAPSRP